MCVRCQKTVSCACVVRTRAAAVQIRSGENGTTNVDIPTVLRGRTAISTQNKYVL